MTPRMLLLSFSSPPNPKNNPSGGVPEWHGELGIDPMPALLSLERKTGFNRGFLPCSRLCWAQGRGEHVPSVLAPSHRYPRGADPPALLQAKSSRLAAGIQTVCLRCPGWVFCLKRVKEHLHRRCLACPHPGWPFLAVGCLGTGAAPLEHLSTA